MWRVAFVIYFATIIKYKFKFNVIVGRVGLS